MAVRFTIGPGHEGLNLDQAEEILLIHALEGIRARIPATEKWVADFDALFYQSDRGVSSRIIDNVNRHLRRLNHALLEFEDTGWTDYMHSRGSQKIDVRQEVRDFVGTPRGDKMLDWAQAAVSRLPSPPVQRIAPVYGSPLRSSRGVPVLSHDPRFGSSSLPVDGPHLPTEVVESDPGPDLPAGHLRVASSSDPVSSARTPFRASGPATDPASAPGRRRYRLPAVRVAKRLSGSGAEDPHCGPDTVQVLVEALARSETLLLEMAADMKALNARMERLERLVEGEVMQPPAEKEAGLPHQQSEAFSKGIFSLVLGRRA